MMPTAEAHYLLGMMDKQAGNRAGAEEHFQVAAQSESPSGQLASRELVLMNLSSDPSRFIGSRLTVDNNNYVWAQIGNMTSVPMKNIEIRYAWLDDKGQTREGRKTFRHTLEGGKQDQMNLGIRLTNASELSQRVRLEVRAASVAE
jgi:hypothetical protein